MNFKKVQQVNHIAYLLVASNKVSLRDLYYNLDMRDICELLEIVCCDNYNNWLRSEHLKNKIQQNKR